MTESAVLSRREIAPALFEITLSKPDGWQHAAGQFARLGLMNGGEAVYRAYSIASAPAEPALRFVIRAVTGGALSPALCALKEGDTVLIDGDAQGNLLPERIPGGNTLWFFATGSGIAPFIAMLADPSVRAPWQRTVLVIGARTAEEIRGLKTLAERFAGSSVTVIGAASREDAGDGLTGRLTDLLETGTLEAKAGETITKDTARVLLCGNPDVLKALRAQFKTRGLVSPRFGAPGQLLVESLW